MFLKFHPRFAPIKAGIFPLVNKDGMPEIAEKLYEELRTQVRHAARLEAVDRQALRPHGRSRHARICFTIDGDTLTDQTVTVRDRDTGAQERIAIDKVERFLSDRIARKVGRRRFSRTRELRHVECPRGVIERRGRVSFLYFFSRRARTAFASYLEAAARCGPSSCTCR